ncbi:MAG: carboxypeptidase-like regulatory domain-containing protein [Candidatus Saccharimonadales bacterium]
MKRRKVGEAGFTLVELTVAIVVIAIIIMGLFALFNSLIRSMIIARRQAVALTLATNQLEYLKSLPYDSLAVQGGSIYATTLLPATTTQTVNGVKYTTTTSIGYVDDAYDGCGSYPTPAVKQLYCRNYPPPAGAPATDLNAADYKIIRVVTKDKTGLQLAAVDTQVTARVAESASTTGALFVTVIDGSGAPVSGATVAVSNTTITPVANISDSTDANGVAIFYNVPPDSNNDYVITASKTGYSTLSTIGVSGTLQPTYPSQKVLAQQSSSLTLRLLPFAANSLVLETTDVNGAPLPGVKVYIKGGYKKYTATTDTAYYYNTIAPTDTRPTTDAAGLAGLTNLVPTNGYTFCGDLGDSNCKAGATTYYLAAAIPYGGMNSLGPIAIPVSPIGSPAPAPYILSGAGYTQQVRLMLTASSSFPRLFMMSPYQLSLATSSLTNFLVTFTGKNLSGASVKFTQGSNSYTGTACTSSTSTAPAYDLLKCSFNLTGVTAGQLQLSVTNGSGTLTLPTTPLGGFNVVP